MENKEITNCNQCPNQCPVDDLKCGRGRHYFEQLRNPDGARDGESGHEHGGDHHGGSHGHGEGHHGGHGHGEGHHGGGHGHGEGHGHGGPGNGRPEDLQGLMRACGHYLHHNVGMDQAGSGEDQLFAALNEEERECLKGLLKKLVESWWQ